MPMALQEVEPGLALVPTVVVLLQCCALTPSTWLRLCCPAWVLMHHPLKAMPHTWLPSPAPYAVFEDHSR